MTSASADLQKLIFDRLVADAGVHAIVADRVLDNRPAVETFPCVTFGPSDVVEDDAECITGRVETIQIDCWARSNARINAVKPLTDAVKDALHLYHVNPPNSALVELRVTAMRVFMDPDGLTAHGVVTVQAIMEE
jgi:hypothetical protein